MRYASSAILVLLSNCFVNFVEAQRLPFDTYSMNEGLVHNHVRDIFQDSKGFIWISTWDGVSMYDGNRFVNYNSSNGLSWSLINQVFETPAGDICIVSNHGEVDMIRKNQRPQPFYRSDIVFNRFRQNTRDTYFALSDDHGIYEFTEGRFVQPSQSKPTDSYYDIVQFNDSLLFALSYNSMQLINQRYELISELPWLSDQCCLLADSKERVWVGTPEGLKLVSLLQEKNQPLRFSPLPAAFNVPQLVSGVIWDMLEDNAGNIWFATSEGLIMIGADGSRQIMTERNGLPSGQINCIMQDREGNIWVGTTKGVTRLVTQSSIRIYSGESGLVSNDIKHLLPLNNGNVIALSESGLQQYDIVNHQFSSLARDRNYYSGGDQNSTLVLIAEGNTDKPLLTFYNQGPDPHFFSPSYTHSSFAYKDHRGNFFYPSHYGVFYSTDCTEWRIALVAKDSRALLIDSHENLWVGLVDSGLYRIRYEYVNDTPRLVQQDHYLPGIGIRSLYEDSKGFIWAGTRYDGVFRLQAEDPESDPLHFDQTAGLTSGFVNSIGEDKKGAIWLDFHYGLDKLIPADTSFRVFNFSRFNHFFTVIHAMIFDRNHALWLATTDGIVSITDGEFENLKPLQVYITAATLGDSIYYDGGKQEIHLNYRHKQVSFQFTAPFFINAKQVLFSYRLLGSNNTSWSLPSNEHNVSYASLEPGTYRFEVRNQGWNGESGEAAAFEFSITPPFWQTPVFNISLVLVLAAVSWWLLRRRIKSIRNEAEMKRQMAETEMIALRSQMNPHFIFNCLNSIDNLMQNNEKEKATAYLARFAKLIRAILENSKQERIPVWKEIETLKLYLDLELLRSDNQFAYKINITNELIEGDYKIPPLVIQPFAENAIQHGLLNKVDAPRNLLIDGEVRNGYIHFMITDNGIGRMQAEKLKQFNNAGHKSLGIQITRERLNLLNRNGLTESVNVTDLFNEAKDATGTRVDIQFKS